MAVASKCPRYAIVQQRGVRILCEANGFTDDATELLVAMLDPVPERRISAAQILTSAWATPGVADSLDLGLTKWSVVLGDKPGEVELPTDMLAADRTGVAPNSAAEAANMEAAAQMAVDRMAAAGGRQPQGQQQGDNSFKKRAATAAAAAEQSSGKKRAVDPTHAGGGGTPAAANGKGEEGQGPSTSTPASTPASTPSSSMMNTGSGFFKHPVFDEAEEEIPGGVNGMLVRSLGWVQLPEEKERMVGDVASALDSLGVKYQVVKGELSDVVWVGQPSESDSAVEELSHQGGVSRRNTLDSDTAIGTPKTSAAQMSSSSLAPMTDVSEAETGEGIARRMSVESTGGGSVPRLPSLEPPAYTQGQLCVRLRIQPGNDGSDAPGSNLHITRHTGDVLQFHSFYRDVRNQLAGANGWVKTAGRYEHVVDEPQPPQPPQ